jgi:hypothetical protein
VGQGFVSAELVPECRTVPIRKRRRDCSGGRFLAALHGPDPATEGGAVIVTRVTVERTEDDVHPGFEALVMVQSRERDGVRTLGVEDEALDQ